MTNKTKTFYIKTFGCQQNVRDSEIIADYYLNKGFKEAASIKSADVVILNSCSVREAAENRVRGLINNLKLLGKAKIVLTGCMVDLYGKHVLKNKIEGVNEFKSINDWQVNNSLSKKGFVNIMTGCNNFCSYCVVPYSRGREISRPIKEIITEVNQLVKNGVIEIMLLGQNVNSYRKDPTSPRLRGASKTPFAELLTVFHEIPGIKKISFMTSNPWDLDDDIIQAMKLPKIDRYLHLPIQSGDNEVLKRMNRKYTVEQYLELVKKIRRAVPEITIGTDIIVGFPGETNKAFQNTVNLCKKVNFVRAFVAMYSPRPKTAAFKLKDDVSHQEKRRRWLVLEKLINKNLNPTP